MHAMQTTVIDDPITWVSVRQAIVLTHLPDGVTSMQQPLHHCIHLFPSCFTVVIHKAAKYVQCEVYVHVIPSVIISVILQQDEMIRMLGWSTTNTFHSADFTARTMSFSIPATAPSVLRYAQELSQDH